MVFSNDDFKFRQGRCFYVAMGLLIISFVNVGLYFAEGVGRLFMVLVWIDLFLIFRLKEFNAEDNQPGDSQQSLLRNSRNSGYEKPYQPYTQEARKRKQEIYLTDSDDEQSLPNSEGGRAWIWF